MESRVNYSAVGGFVVLMSAVLITLGLWLGADISPKVYRQYDALFNESVSGLNVNAPVKYRGVDIGRVSRIQLSPENLQQVRVELDIESHIPIKADTLAMLSTQGVTGIAYIELEGGSTLAAPLAPDESGRNPTLQTKPSLFTRIDDAMSEVFGTLSMLSKDVNLLLNDENRESVRTTLHNLVGLSKVIGEHSDDFAAVISHASTFMSNAEQASESLPQLMSELEQALNEFNQTATVVRNMSQNADTMLGDIHVELNRVLGTSGPEINTLIERINTLAEEMSTLSRKITREANPLLFRPTLVKPGPGEE
jgi:phospholipid/cholesterol/gamma-HCH transport system substrate-binding protein